MTGIAKKVFAFFASYGFAVVVLFFLLVLTLLGTLDQVENGLHAAQKKYFESPFVVEYFFGVLPIPLPGVYTLLVLLTINLVCGALIRARKDWRRPGMLIAHSGLLLLVAYGFYTHEFSHRGHMTLFEGESSDQMQSFFEYEIVVTELGDQPDRKEFVIRDPQFTHLATGESKTFTHPDMPFDLTVEGFQKNVRPGKALAQAQGIDGIWFEAMPPEVEAERNMPGAYVTTLEKGSAAAGDSGMLWSVARAPWVTKSSDGREWAIDLRNRRWDVPFTIVLDDFTRELHPRTGMASSFESRVKLIENNVARTIEIKMNEPLRHKGYTLYQASWGPQNAGPNQPLFSTFEVTKNPAEQWPLYACYIITLGMLIHFSQKLWIYMRREARRRNEREHAAAEAAESPAAAKHGKKRRKATAAAATSVLLLATLALAPGAAAQEKASGMTTPAWPDEAVALFEKLPIQDGGRVKPLDTFARFTLLRLNGSWTYRDPSGFKLSAVPWLMNVLFYPEAARAYPHFRVDDTATVVSIGMDDHGKKRDRFSYNEIAPARDKLMQLAQQYQQIEAAKRSPVERQIVDLANNVFEFELIAHFLDYARASFPVAPDSALAAAFPEAGGPDLGTVLRRMPEVLNTLRSRSEELSEDALQQEVSAVARMFETIKQTALSAQGLAIFPNMEPGEKEWLTPNEVVLQALDLENPRAGKVPWVASLETLADNRTAAQTAFAAGKTAEVEQLNGAFLSELSKFSVEVLDVADERGEYSKVPLEVFLYHSQILFYSQWLFVLSFVLVAMGWLFPRANWLHKVNPIAVAVPLTLLIAGITIRCIIRERPPVSTLYETLLFITATAVLVALIIEYVNRQRIAVAMAAILGSLGMFLAFRYEAMDGQDTMPALIAVLDTNFWLATHVTTVTVGYAAGLLAGAIAHVYVLGRLFNFRKNTPGFYKEITRMVYGILCFGVLFATVGTVLGGIWANDSWGRFWGWDPKENGALMIVLWGVIILHARMGGYIRDLGVNAAAIVLGMIVAFSWWGVNLLGVGLHSYGFTSGIWGALMIFWGSQGAVLLLALWVYLRERDERRTRAANTVRGKASPRPADTRK